MLGRHVIELPDYSIQQVERAEYQPAQELGNSQLVSASSRKYFFILLLAVVLLIYRN